MLNTARLHLTDFDEADIADYQAMTAHSVYQQFYKPEECSAAFGEKLVRAFIAQSETKPRLKFQLAVREKRSNRFLGTVGLRLSEEQTKAEVGFGFAVSAQGQGFAAEALTALMAWSTQFPLLRLLTADTVVENVAAVRLLTALGFKESIEQRQVEQLGTKTLTRTQFTKTV